MRPAEEVENPSEGRSNRVAESRSAERYPAFGASIQLGWWEGAEFRTVAGLLKDISRCGAAALAEAAPPRDAKVMFRLSGALHTEWVEASVIEVTKNRWFRRVPRQVRMQFLEPCPYHVFQAAIDVLIMECRASSTEPDGRDGLYRGAHRGRPGQRRTGRPAYDPAR